MSTHGHNSMRGFLQADTDLTLPVPAAPPVEASVPEGTATAIEQTYFDPTQAELSAALPEDVALLCVTSSRSNNQPRLNLSWHYRRSVRVSPYENVSADMPLSDLSLSKLVEETASCQGGTPWRKAYFDAMSWWLSPDRLIEWVRELIAVQGECRLVIWDNTAYEIPWELFYCESAGDADDRTQGWLGELIPVIRWTSIHDGIRNWNYSAEERHCEGGLLMLEDEAFGEESDSIDIFLVEPPTRSIPDLMNRLEEASVPEFGLLLIRCRGIYSKDSREFTLGELSLNEYREFTMSALHTSRAPVLLNACSSGRTVTDSRRPGMPVRSFAELFLRRGASAVIAAVGEIDLNHSHDFARRLLFETTDDKTRLAEVLHNHRKHYARSVRRARTDSRSEADFRLFFDSFMYVYYGHPNTTLRTVPRDQRSSP